MVLISGIGHNFFCIGQMYLCISVATDDEVSSPNRGSSVPSHPSRTVADGSSVPSHSSRHIVADCENSVPSHAFRCIVADHENSVPSIRASRSLGYMYEL